jgi:hypothetical protein
VSKSGKSRRWRDGDKSGIEETRIPENRGLSPVSEQQKGRALWWDKAPRPLAAMKEAETATVPNKAYFYDAN